eukprot:PLAT157.1.p1 GENE.PLAT157.1~~PLAT157.1.p1  ORF type:complete len:1459 (-),score=711.94 PLAT157.1:104-4480(-)
MEQKRIRSLLVSDVDVPIGLTLHSEPWEAYVLVADFMRHDDGRQCLAERSGVVRIGDALLSVDGVPLDRQRWKDVMHSLRPPRAAAVTLEFADVGERPLMKRAASLPARTVESVSAEAAAAAAARAARPRVPNEDKAGLWSRLTFSYMGPLLRRGAEEALQESDLAPVAAAEQPSPQVDRLWASLRQAGYLTPLTEEERAAGLERPAGALWKLCIWQFRSWLSLAALLELVYALLSVLPVMSLKWLLELLASDEPPQPLLPGVSWMSWLSEALAASLLLWFALIARPTTRQHKALSKIRAGALARVSFISVIHRKLLHITTGAKMRLTSGLVLNLAGTDTDRMGGAIRSFNDIWALCLRALIAFALLYRQMGIAALAATLSTAVIMAANLYLFRRLSALRRIVSERRDARMKAESEAIQGIRAVKSYAWEGAMLERVAELRKEELRAVALRRTVAALSSALNTWSPVFMTVVTFLTFTLFSGGKLTPALAFSSLQLLAMLRRPLKQVPNVMAALAAARVSARRLISFFGEEETVDYRVDDGLPVGAVQIEAADFRWSGCEAKKKKKTRGDKGGGRKKRAAARKRGQGGELELTGLMAGKSDSSSRAEAGQADAADGDSEAGVPPWLLSGVTLQLAPGSFTVVTGAVGVGKSSLLAALLGDMPLVDGNVAYNGRVAYCPQTPWIFNGTLRENVLMGADMRWDDYKRALQLAQLSSDLAILVAGDQTGIGSRGVNLSGGQKARVALARAIYADADIYLLDDVLSSVDAHVGRRIFHDCLLEALAGKTRLFITHATQFAPLADSVMLMDGSGLRQLSADEVAALADGSEEGGDGEVASEGEAKEDDAAAGKDSDKDGSAVMAGVSRKDADGAGKLVQAEDRQVGKVGLATYLHYLRSVGYWHMSAVTLLSLLQPTVALLPRWWISMWSGDVLHETLSYYVSVYAAVACAVPLLTLFAGIYWIQVSVAAGRSIHQSMVAAVLRATLSFFDSNPSGRILNRFGGDSSRVDTMLPSSMRACLLRIFTLVTTAVSLALIQPELLLGLPLMLYAFLRVQMYATDTMRELRRLGSRCGSPIFAQLSETLDGSDSIAIYGQQAASRALMEERVEMALRMRLRTTYTNRWMAMRLNLLGSITLLATCLLATLRPGSIPAALVGLAILQGGELTSNIGDVVKAQSSLELNMTSLERVLTYTSQLPQEAAAVVADCRPPTDSWPRGMSLQLKDIVVRYRPELPPALNGLTLRIEGSQRVGICGRTGSGKSTLVQLLFRLVEPEGGSITLGGVDLCSLGLHDLRSRLAVIPQDPVLFAGSVRYNLDPWLTTSDSTLWDMLAAVELRDTVAAMPAGLDSAVMEGGSGWSVGQRQLFCLARTLLRGASLLVLDEATAYVDRETDALVQAALRRRFGDATVLTIAHRLDSIMDSDVLLVLDEGKLVQQGSPEELLRDEAGAFYSLVETARSSGVR